MKLNKPLIRKVIKRLEKFPETYDQGTFGSKFETYCMLTSERPEPPCGTVACIAGETIICNSETVELGLKILYRIGDIRTKAEKALGISDEESFVLFTGNPKLNWAEPFSTQYAKAKTYKDEARAAINYLKDLLKTGKVKMRY